ncbi:MAG: hypothetical protein GY863_18800 [bacterium]|nr:hypothetical protein [bacterium]
MKFKKRHLVLIILLIVLGVSIINVSFDRYILPDRPDIEPVFHTYRGSVHFHSVYSDGGGDFNRIILAAKNTGMDFLISADHNTLESLSSGEEGYRDGVLTVAGVELSTEYGHMFYVHPDTSIADVPVDSIFYNHRTPFISRGSFIIAHPFLPRHPYIHWEWESYKGFELFNSDYEWRNDSPVELLQALIAFPFFDSSLNFLADVPEKGLAMLDSILTKRTCIITAAGDVHARIDITDSFFLGFPSYERGFNTVQTYISSEEAFTGDFTEDKKRLLTLLGKGSSYTACGGFSDPQGFEFYIKTGDNIHTMGDTVSVMDDSKLIITVPDTTDIKVILIKDGQTIVETDDWRTEYPVTEPGVYRVEVYQMRKSLPFFTRIKRPWIFSNPIYVK